MRVLVLGAGLAGLAACERLLDAGADVTVVDSFPLPGGRIASFEVSRPVAGLVAGDVVEHGLHAYFQHYHALFGLLERAGVERPAFRGQGVFLWNARHGHSVVEGGPFSWLVRALNLPEDMRGPRGAALVAFARLIGYLAPALRDPERTDRESAISLLRRFDVPEPAIASVFRPCMFSLTSLALEELSALELIRWLSRVLADPRIRAVDGGTTQVVAAPICEHLRSRGADFRFGVEVLRLALDHSSRVQIELAQAPDRTGVRHLLVRDFAPAEPPDPRSFDAVVSTLPWERLLEVSRGDPALEALPAWSQMRRLRNVHPLTIRLWFERPIAGAEDHYILCSDTLFDVVRPTPEPNRARSGIQLLDLLIEDVETHLPGFHYDRERYLDEPPHARVIEARVLADLERMYPGQIANNPVQRRFLHTRAGIIACEPGSFGARPPQYLGLERFAIGGDWTRQPWGVCMEGAVRSGQLAALALLTQRAPEPEPWAFGPLARSFRGAFERS